MMLSIYTVKWSAYVVCIEYKSFRRLESKYIYTGTGSIFDLEFRVPTFFRLETFLNIKLSFWMRSELEFLI